MAGDRNFKNESLFLLASINDPDLIVDINILIGNHHLQVSADYEAKSKCFPPNFCEYMKLFGSAAILKIL